MALAKKGSRKITISGNVYRWKIRHKPTYTQCVFSGKMTAAVELSENPGAVLLITFPWVSYDSWIGNPEKPVTPKHIEQSIQAALSMGWNPNEKGKIFEYSHIGKN